MRRVAVLAAAAALALAGCGDDDEPAATSTPQETARTPEVATATPAPATVPTVAAPESEAPLTTPTATTGVPEGGAGAPEDAPGGAGDEEAIRTPAEFSIAAGGVDPELVTVPAFLAVELRLVARDGRAHDVQVDAPGGGLVALAAGATATKLLAGLQPGEYAIVVDGGKARATLRVTREAAGP